MAGLDTAVQVSRFWVLNFPQYFPLTASCASKIGKTPTGDVGTIELFQQQVSTAMKTLPLTQHAAVRLQQRAIPPLVVDLLNLYGARQPAGSGAEMVYMDKAARRRMCQAIGAPAVAALQPVLSAYLIESDTGQVITAGWRCSRVQRDRSVRRGR